MVLGFSQEHSRTYCLYVSIYVSIYMIFGGILDMSMYQTLFDLIHTHIYGGVTLTPDMNLVCTLLSTIGVIFVIAIPFYVVYKVLCFVGSFGGWR